MVRVDIPHKRHAWETSFASEMERPISFCRSCRDSYGLAVLKFANRREGGRIKAFQSDADMYTEVKMRIGVAALVGRPFSALPWWIRMMFDDMEDAQACMEYYPSEHDIAEMRDWDKRVLASRHSRKHGRHLVQNGAKRNV